jgi:hypothetical protein
MVEEVLPQPFLLRFGTAAGQFRRHVPDFLAVLRDGSRWLFDVRPAELVEEAAGVDLSHPLGDTSLVWLAADRG